MRCSIDETQESDEMDEDERMVEDLLNSPTSPSSPARTPHPSMSGMCHTPTSSSAYRPRKTSLSVHMIPLDHTHYELPSPNTSLSATTDSFYLVSLQSGHSHAPSSSVFAQAGRPAAHSPFLKHHMQCSPFGHGSRPCLPPRDP